MKTVPCECACGALVDSRKLQLVRVTSGAARVRGTTAFQDARSFRVAPACVRPFMRELRATERVRATHLRLATLPRWRRLRFLPRLWLLRRAALRRRLGEAVARRQAWSAVWFALRVPRTRRP